MTRWEPIDEASGQQPVASTGTPCAWLDHRHWLLALVLVIVTFVAYQPTWRAGFIWDDDDHLTANPAMTAPDGLKLIWSSLAVSRYYPLTLTSFWIQRRLWGLNPLPYHLVNVALHAANGVLVFLLLRRLRVRAAWLAAIVWAIHPVNVESVAWISELKNTQSGLFFLLSLLFFLQFETGAARRGWYALALLSGLAALLSKPSTVVLPLALLLCIWWERGSWRRTDILRTAPFFLMALGMSALTVIEQRGHIRRESSTEWNLGMAERFVLAGKATWFYALKVLWPARLTFVYPRWNLNATSFWSWLPLGGLVVGGAILWAWRRQLWARAALFGCGFFVLALLPVLGFFNVYYFRYSFVADHFSYLASMGLVAVVVAGFATIVKTRLATAFLSAGLVVLLGWQTWQHSHDFHDSETLWQATLHENPATALAHNNLGNLYQVSGQLDRALFHLQQAAQLEPNYAEVHSNLGIVLERLGRPNNAAAQFAEAARLNPNNRDIQFNLAHALELLGQDTAAIEHARAGMKWGTPTTENYLCLSRLLVKTANYAEAIETLRQAHQAVPTHLHLANELAWLLAACPDPGLRRPDEALRLSEQLCAQTQNRVPELLDTLAACYAASGRFPDAVEMARQAVHLAESQQQGQLAASIRSRLDGYEGQRPASYDQGDNAASPR